MIKINGAYGEGGGQILRTCLTLSVLTRQPVLIENIRANRSKPGLRPQHLSAVKAMANLSNAEIMGDVLSSQMLQFSPSKVSSGKYTFKIRTAGALSLVLQTIFLPLSFANSLSHITLTGGTHVNWSPSYHYLQEQWLPIMLQIGFRLELNLIKTGFYPEGGGEVKVIIRPAQEMHPFRCQERGELIRVRGLSGVANLDDGIAKRQKYQALRRLYEICQDSKINTVHLPSPGKGTFILLKADFLQCGSACFSGLGAPGKRAERVADEAVDQMLGFLETNGTVDHFLADQLLLPLAVIPERSIFRTNQITQHLITNAHVIREFLPAKIEIEGELNKPGLIKIEGVSQK